MQVVVYLPTHKWNSWGNWKLQKHMNGSNPMEPRRRRDLQNQTKHDPSFFLGSIPRLIDLATRMSQYYHATDSLLNLDQLVSHISGSTRPKPVRPHPYIES